MKDPELRAVVVLCAAMVVEVLIFPGTWRVGLVPKYKEFIEWITPTFAPVPNDIGTKYENHPAVRFLHILPGAIWAGLIPIQLNINLRKASAARHRLFGMLLVTSSVCIIAGYVLMDLRGMTKWRAWMRGATSWFAWAAACAWRGNIRQHGVWMTRHVAAGIWVVVQRVLIALVTVSSLLGLVDMGSEEIRELWFYSLGPVSFLITMLACERYLRRQQKHLQAKQQ